jgi:acetyl-CoA carboxylase carboxyl transferase subunit alpha
MAEKFNMPIITFIDTPGAYPGVDAEEKGQSEAIATNMFTMIQLRVPIICVVIGEGGSGGALAIGVGDRIIMLEHSVYSVISPEGCASILWEDKKKNAQAADALCLTANHLLKFKIIDQIVREPLGGAHRNHKQAAILLKKALRSTLSELEEIDTDKMVELREEKFRQMGKVVVVEA